MNLNSRVPINSGDARLAVRRYGASPRTAAVPVLPLAQYGSQAWLDARRAMIGASEMAAVLGLSPYASPFSLWWSKQEGWDAEQTFSMRVGHLLEPVIAELFAEDRPDLLVCRAIGSLWRHPDIEWLGCTPDYLAVAGQPETPGSWIEPVEVKSDEGGRGWGKPGSDEVPEHHRVQVLIQCAVFGAPRGHLVRMAGKRFSTYVVPRDAAQDKEIADWVAEGAAFLTSLEIGTPPDPDGHQATSRALTRLHPAVDEQADALIPDGLAAEYERLCELVNTAKAGKKHTENLIREQLGQARYGLYASTGRRFVDRRMYKRRGYTVAPTEVDALYPVAAKSPKHAKEETEAS